MVYLFTVFAVFFLYTINSMTNLMCLLKEIPEDRQPQLFRTINVLITILLISTYIEILYAV
ncbi:hypothetical protein M670_04122 [Schinkia azotoformans MEV2011]|uniref:Uncharacterized protein n=2 Tax=Schinkia azotoformans TaxID=1454 RepID=K6DDB4_SCHAZ|nr:hypothetical protein [Schinkia azotoformans]EKN70497.1 hypothetical protein BAZO_01087 [Schinkia azotoformans LMG 9581]KEF36705.1 hypothetical protein M670_04122 [Schinkia azotoformans MEV2011]MEC1638975.1 hypothetical protein [Schinkia azotoformans]MEC1695412.1 hypothetical protein [Schinkia azotoformans]MEC1715091.1 hypothetical protein [Schinkia azotoformans]